MQIFLKYKNHDDAHRDFTEMKNSGIVNDEYLSTVFYEIDKSFPMSILPLNRKIAKDVSPLTFIEFDIFELNVRDLSFPATK